jgi:hypothetical protein
MLTFALLLPGLLLLAALSFGGWFTWRAFRSRSWRYVFLGLLGMLGLLERGVGLVVAAIGASFTCFDQCPQDLPGAVRRVLALAFAPGAILAGAAWLLSIVLLSQMHERLRLAVVGLSLPVCAPAAGVALLLADGGQLLPATEQVLVSWTRALEFAVLPIALCWPLAVLVASRPDAARQRAGRGPRNAAAS